MAKAQTPDPSSWLQAIIDAMNELGGQAGYNELYPKAKKLWEERNHGQASPAFEATIRRTVEDHGESSDNFKKRKEKKPSLEPLFYSLEGHGKGVWGLVSGCLDETASPSAPVAYQAGVEGILKEGRYLRRSRNPWLVEARKKQDDHACQACGYRQQGEAGSFIIDVHHLNPLAAAPEGGLETQLEDLICLCPNCHRIAHSRKDKPLDLNEIKLLSGRWSPPEA